MFGCAVLCCVPFRRTCSANVSVVVVVCCCCTAQMVGKGDVLITVGEREARAVSTELEPILLSVFSHRFDCCVVWCCVVLHGGSRSIHTSQHTRSHTLIPPHSHNRFMSIAEQMGRTLQRTAISTNIKERLDFSCALFGYVKRIHSYMQTRTWCVVWCCV